MSLALPRLARVTELVRAPAGQREREIRTGRLLMVPALIAPVCLAAVFLMGIYVTTQNWRLTSGNAGFVGLNNYGRVLTDAKFWHSSLLTLKFTALDVVTEVFLATLMALALNQALRGIRIFRSLLILPLMTPPVVGALVWRDGPWADKVPFFWPIQAAALASWAICRLCIRTVDQRRMAASEVERTADSVIGRNRREDIDRNVSVS